MHFFCINIETATDRRAHCEAEFAKADIDVTFVNGFDARLNNIRHQNENFKIGHLGCYLSHLHMMEEVRRYDLSPAIVFEDDIWLVDDFKNKLDAALQTLPADWEVAFIGWWPGYMNYDNITTVPVNEDWIKITSGILWGCYGYIINGRKGGDKLVKTLQPITTHTDDKLMAEVISENVKGYFLYPQLVYHTGAFKSQTQDPT